MADQKDHDMNEEDFSQDVKTDVQMNGGGGNSNSNSSSSNDCSNKDISNQQSQLQSSGEASSGSQSQSSQFQQNGSSEGAPGRDDDRKLFIGGLSWETTEKELREHFGQYGEIESINVKTDPQTGRSRGFAFIVYTSAEAIEKVVQAGEHIINNKKVDPKKAKARHGKIFVGGLTPEISDDEIRTFFTQFGNIVELEMPFDKQKNQRKGFCFITFDSEQVVNELLKTPKQTICGKEVDVKKATPKPENMPMAMMRGGTRGGRGGRGGRSANPKGYGQSWGNQGYSYGQGYGYSGYDGYGGSGYDYYGGYGGYGGYDYSGYGNYGGSYQSGKQRGTGRQQRHQPY